MSAAASASIPHPMVRVRRRRGGKKPSTVFENAGPAGRVAIFIAVLTLAAPLLGGSTTLWAQAALAFGTGMLWLFVTPRRPLGWPAAWLALGLLALGSVAFLPAHWLGAASWRTSLANLRGLALPGTLSPQPWLSLETMGWLAIAVLWAWQLFSFEWTGRGRALALRMFGGGIILLAALSLAAIVAKFKVPFWPAVGNSPLDSAFSPIAIKRPMSSRSAAFWFARSARRTYATANARRGVGSVDC